MTTLYEKWRASFGRDGPEYNAPKNVQVDEINQFIDDLISNIGYFEALELGFLKSVKAIETLKNALENSTNSESLAYAKALWLIENDPKYLPILLNYIADTENTNEIERVEAINLLAGIKHADVFSALEGALYDSEYLVRYNAAQIYSYNSARSTHSDTILRNVKEFDKSKLQKLAGILREKTYT